MYGLLTMMVDAGTDSDAHPRVRVARKDGRSRDEKRREHIRDRCSTSPVREG